MKYEMNKSAHMKNVHIRNGQYITLKKRGEVAARVLEQVAFLIKRFLQHKKIMKV